MKRANEKENEKLTSKKERRSNYTGFSEYMNAKEDKLRVQFDSNIKIESEIFRGVCIHVNGLTRPPLSVLRTLILQHGGEFEQYYHRDRVTHFICTHVAKAKLENFIKRSNGKIKVMRPEWITDSVKAGKLLEEYKYRNYLHEDAKQNNLHRFFEQLDKKTIEENDIEADEKEFYDPEELKNLEQLEIKDELNEAEDLEDQIDSDDLDDADDIELLAGLIEDDETENDVEVETEYNAIDVDSNVITENSSASTTSPMRTKTSADPAFLNEYYQNSRLHYLSTWREELKTFAGDLMKSKKRQQQQQRDNACPKVVMHVDLDCFFVSVSLLSHPEREALRGKPIAVTHAKNENFNISDSSADISSCNYEARAFGIKNDMYIRQALKLCPELKMIPYDFEAYNRVSRLFYEILATWADELQAVSCDEAFIEVSRADGDFDHVALEIRNEIRDRCKVEASIGLGPNLLIARLATKRAKPNGQFWVKSEETDEFMAGQLIENLPGVGDALIEKLPENMKTCANVLELSLGELQNRLGHRQGLNLYRKVRGEDDRVVGVQGDRKSVGSEISWGVRFASTGQCKRFIEELAAEVWQRMLEAFPSVPEPKPKRIQVKLYRRQEGAGESKKHLGRGICDTFHRSRSFPKGIVKESVLVAEVWQLFETEYLKGLGTDVQDVRGIGLFLTEFACNFKSTSKDISKLFASNNNNTNNANRDIVTASQVDSEIWGELPEDIRKEYENEWKRLNMTRDNRAITANINTSNNSNSKSTSKKVADKKNKFKSVTLTQMWGHREEREAAQLLQEISALPSDQFDHQVLLALPRDLQLEILADWKREQKRAEVTKFCDSNMVPVIQKHKEIDPSEVLKVVECLPIDFKGRKDWTLEQLYAFVLNYKDSTDPAVISELDVLLVDLTLRDHLKGVSDLCGILKENRLFEEVLQKIQRLVSDLYAGCSLKY